ncbi:hypothetical protein D3C74_69560 [compost metagenome]
MCLNSFLLPCSMTRQSISSCLRKKGMSGMVYFSGRFCCSLVQRSTVPLLFSSSRNPSMLNSRSSLHSSCGSSVFRKAGSGNRQDAASSSVSWCCLSSGRTGRVVILNMGILVTLVQLLSPNLLQPGRPEVSDSLA